MIACQKMILLHMKTWLHLCLGKRTYYTAISVPLKPNNLQIHCLLRDIYMHCIPSEKLLHFTQRGETGREAYNPQKVDEMRARSTQRSTGILEAAHTVSITSIIKRKRQKDKQKADGLWPGSLVSFQSFHVKTHEHNLHLESNMHP